MHCVDEEIEETNAPAAGRVPSSVVSATERARADAQRAAEERRAHRRVPGKMLQWLSAARVKYGPEVTIVDLSSGGALLQSDRPLAPGSRQALEIVGPDKSIVVPFGVLRSRLTAVDSRGTTYRAACSFGKPLDLPELAQAAAVGDTPAVDAVPEPALAAVDVTPVVTEVPAATPQAGPADAPTPPGWQKIVARFTDGRTLKGYTDDFDVTKPRFSLQILPNAPAAARVPIKLADLKALFFVRDFGGNPEYRERKTFCGPTQGRKIQVTLVDGEVIVGTTQGYRAGGPGFYVTPADPRANNAKIFLVSSAVRQVRFP
jgi:hypothetical protein